VKGCPNEIQSGQSSKAGELTPAASLTLKSKRSREERTPSPDSLELPAYVKSTIGQTATKSKGPERFDTSAAMAEDNNEFSAIVKEAKSLGHLPLDDSDDEADEEDSDARNWKRKKIPKYQESFSCMQKSDGSSGSDNPNARTIEILSEMGKFYDRIHDNWRTIAYRKAVSLLKRQSELIATKEDALKLYGIGNRLAEKIEEIIVTNKLRRLDNVKNDPSDQILQKFLQIYGVGLSQASRWVQAGYKSLDDIQANVQLTDNQKIGIAHYDDFMQRIPRTEVEKHGNVVRDALQAIDPSFQVTVGGSYRRGSETSGDVDLIITKPGATRSILKTIVMETLVPRLFKAGFFKASLAAGNYGSALGSKWHGASALPGSAVWRRLDLLLVPWDEIGAALIYFTGNDIFNRSIRLLARKKGMRLNQCGLFKNVMRDKAMTKMTEAQLVESRSEKRIFEILGVPWRLPTDRNC
jgi:DNA polymerase IV